LKITPIELSELQEVDYARLPRILTTAIIAWSAAVKLANLHL
jgi:hypothetical protein